jgi:hypothetical protein
MRANHCRRIRLVIHEEEARAGKLRALQNWVQECGKGISEVVVDYQRGDASASLSLGKDNTIQLRSDSYQKLIALFGEERCTLEYA